MNKEFFHTIYSIFAKSGKRVFIFLVLFIIGSPVYAGSVQYLGQPCRCRKISTARVIRQEKTGKEWFVLASNNETEGMDLVFVDFSNNTAKSYRCPVGIASYTLKELPGDRLAVGTFSDAGLTIFDLNSKTFINSINVPGERYIMSMDLGPDGRLYAGTFPGGKLVALDLENFSLTACGAPAPSNAYLRYVSAAPEGGVLCRFWMEKRSLVYYPLTKTFMPVPTELNTLDNGVIWEGYLLAGTYAFNGKPLQRVDPLPFPPPDANIGAWCVDTRMTTNTVLYLRQGRKVFSYKKGDAALTKVVEIDLHGGNFYGATQDGKLLGYRGGDYFVCKPGDKDLNLQPIPVEEPTRSVYYLRTDNKDLLWGSPLFGQYLFYMNVKTKKVVNTPWFSDIDGDVGDAVFFNGKFYAACYCYGEIFVFDPSSPWDQLNGKNPKRIATLGPDYIRPNGIVLGPDNKLYAAWEAKYGVYGGALSITDPVTEETELLENPLGMQVIYSIDVGEKYIYISTSLNANGLLPKSGELPKFGVIDIVSRKVVFTKEFPGLSIVVANDAKTKRVAVGTYDGKIHIFDPSKLKFVGEPLDGAPAKLNKLLRAPGNGKVYFGHKNSVIALDMMTNIYTIVTDLPNEVSQLVSDGKVIYVFCGADMYSINPKP